MRGRALLHFKTLVTTFTCTSEPWSPKSFFPVHIKQWQDDWRRFSEEVAVVWRWFERFLFLLHISFGRWWCWWDYSQKFLFCVPTLVSQTTQPLRWPYNHLSKLRAVNLRSCQCAITNFQLFTPCYFSRWELVSDNSQQTVFSSPSLCHWGPVLSCQCPITNFQLFTTWYFYFWRWPVVLFPGEGV